MSYPIPLARYDQVLVTTLLRPNMPVDPAELVGGDASRWEIVGITSSGDVWVALLGRVRAGVAVREVTDEFADR